jgi:exopolysaccharide biosynthesis polyprenyl glycosylphosphotransferase
MTPSPIPSPPRGEGHTTRRRRNNTWLTLKPLVDAILIVLAFAIAYWVRYHLQWVREVEPAYWVPFSVYVPSVALLTGILVAAYWLEGAYRAERGRLFFDEFAIVFRGTVTGIAVMIVIVFLVWPNYYSRLIFGYSGIATLFLLGITRAVERYMVGWRRRHGRGVDRVLIIGAGEVAHSIMRTVCARPELGYQIVGFLDTDPSRASTDIGRFQALGTLNSLEEVLTTNAIDEVIVTLPWTMHGRVQRIMGECERQGVPVRIVPDLFQMTLSKVEVDNLNGIPLMGIREPVLRDWQVLTKRALDVVLASLGLLILSPIFLVVAVAIRLDSPGPIIFRQERIGKGGEEFTCLKFRSMCVDAEARIAALKCHNEASGPLFKMRQDPRRTLVGRFLRRTSLDELPQLWNVLRGEMSIVGPRPALDSEVREYAPWHRRRLEVAPGITGLWQVSGRSDLTFDEGVLLDVYYIENWSLFLDLRILVKTVPSVLLGLGAY